MDLSYSLLAFVWVEGKLFELFRISFLEFWRLDMLLGLVMVGEWLVCSTTAPGEATSSRIAVLGSWTLCCFLIMVETFHVIVWLPWPCSFSGHVLRQVGISDAVLQ